MLPVPHTVGPLNPRFGTVRPFYVLAPFTFRLDSIKLMFKQNEIASSPKHRQLPRKFDPKDVSWWLAGL